MLRGQFFEKNKGVEMKGWREFVSNGDRFLASVIPNLIGNLKAYGIKRSTLAEMMGNQKVLKLILHAK